MKFATLVALVGYTTAIRLQFPEKREPGCPGNATSASNSTFCADSRHSVEVSAETAVMGSTMYDNVFPKPTKRGESLAQWNNHRTGDFPIQDEPGCKANLGSASNSTTCVGNRWSLEVAANTGTTESTNYPDNSQKLTRGAPAAPANLVQWNDHRTGDFPVQYESGCRGDASAASTSTICAGSRHGVTESGNTSTTGSTNYPNNSEKLTRGGVDAPLNLAQGPNGTVHDEQRFDPPAVVVPPPAPPVNDNIHPGTTLTPYVDPATTALAQGPNGSIHPEGTFDPPATPPAPPALAQGPNGSIHPEGTFDPPATPPAPPALAQGPNGSIHPEGTFDPPATPPTPPALAQGPNGTVHPEPTFVTQPQNTPNQWPAGLPSERV